MSLVRKLGVFASLSLLSALGSCKDGMEQPEAEVASTSRAAIIKNGAIWNGAIWNGAIWNGAVWNGAVWNGILWNGAVWNGAVWNGAVWNGILWNGIVIESAGFRGDRVSLNGSVFSVSDGRRTLSGAQLKGAVFSVEVLDKNGGKVPFDMRFEDVRPAPNVPTQDVWLYRITGRPGNAKPTDPWVSMCSDEQGNPDEAVPLAGTWDEKTGNYVPDPKAITWGCRDFVLGKCVVIGYRPWAKATQCTPGPYRNKICTEVALRDYHQACTRMIRADYCGNGTSYTISGTIIDVYDYLTPPLNVPETDWDIEARWTQSGALCLSEPRHPELLIRWRWPDCDGDGKADKLRSCRDDPTTRNQGMLVTRVQEWKPGHH